MSALSATLIDTDAFSLLFVRLGSPDPRVAPWRELLRGRNVLVSFQTRAELLMGAASDGWGPRRTSGLRAILDATPTIGIDRDVVDTFAALYAACRRAGHGLHGRTHTGDRWIAACAIAKDVPLLAGDGIYRDTPDLKLLT